MSIPVTVFKKRRYGGDAYVMYCEHSYNRIGNNGFYLRPDGAFDAGSIEHCFDTLDEINQWVKDLGGYIRKIK